MGGEVLQGNSDVAQATALWLRTVTESRFYYSQSRFGGDERWPGQPLRTNLACASIPRALGFEFPRRARRPAPGIDRESTRLNSSHRHISYGLLLLEKKKTER